VYGNRHADRGVREAVSIAGGLTVKRLVLALFATALFGALVPSVALAKGASEATLTGPGIGSISFAGEGSDNGGQLMQIAEEAGFFPAVYATSPNPMLSQQPEGTLGPRYRITYVMPGPNDEINVIRQELYPYAAPAPVTYTEPGQSYYATEKTVGGWYVASSMLKDDLIGAGLPETAPAGGGSDFPWTFAAVVVAALAAVAVAALGAVRVRRRPGPATA
jgi:hypothetical protein